MIKNAFIIKVVCGNFPMHHNKLSFLTNFGRVHRKNNRWVLSDFWVSYWVSWVSFGRVLGGEVGEFWECLSEFLGKFWVSFVHTHGFCMTCGWVGIEFWVSFDWVFGQVGWVLGEFCVRFWGEFWVRFGEFGVSFGWVGWALSEFLIEFLGKLGEFGVSFV